MATGVMCELNEKGDTKVVWDKANADEVANARRTFDELTKDGKFTAFQVGALGKKGDRITKFDPNAETILLVPRLAGG